ncbi:hypothetical protein VTI74DRAFT_4479 [Chaetomium olivicolor]
MSTPPPNLSPQEEEGYKHALALLSSLQSNRAITSLFESLSPAQGKDGTPFDMNSLAIPEMLAWLGRAGYTPQSIAESGMKCVHVAGTKGKGSVSALIVSILAQYHKPQRGAPVAGGKRGEEEGCDGSPRADVTETQASAVGLYISPHVLSVRERIALDARPIPVPAFTRYLHSLWDRFTLAARAEAASKGLSVPDADLAGPATKPFYFRFLTILALHVFVSERVRSAVVECGIGGEYDATNILPAEAVTATVVTQLGIDHVSMLGDTVEKIAWHKSGIFKPGVKAFTRKLAGSQETVMEVLRQRAREKGAVLVEVGDEEVERWDGVEGARLQGPWQKFNMALAVYAAREHLLRMGVRFEGRFGTEEWQLADIPEEFVKGLREAALRGRCEVFKDEQGVEWHVDGAHTDDSLAGVGRWFAGRAKEDGVRVLVFNQQERDPSGLLRALLAGAQSAAGGMPLFTHAVFTRNEEQQPTGGESRDLSVQTKAQETMAEVNSATATIVHDSVQKTVDHVRDIAAQAKQNGKPCQVLVTGSFHLVGAILKNIDRFEY